jgi:hypothetical protein
VVAEFSGEEKAAKRTFNKDAAPYSLLIHCPQDGNAVARMESVSRTVRPAMRSIDTRSMSDHGPSSPEPG